MSRTYEATSPGACGRFLSLKRVKFHLRLPPKSSWASQVTGKHQTAKIKTLTWTGLSRRPRWADQFRTPLSTRLPTPRGLSCCRHTLASLSTQAGKVFSALEPILTRVDQLDQKRYILRHNSDLNDKKLVPKKGRCEHPLMAVCKVGSREWKTF